MIFRGKLCAALKQAGLLNQVPRQVWKKDWVVNCKAAGQGRQVLNYLARYIFRVAITNSRLERIENGQVTFRYRDNRSQQLHASPCRPKSSSTASCCTRCRAVAPK